MYGRWRPALGQRAGIPRGSLLFQLGKDLFDYGRVFDTCDDLDGTTARVTDRNIDIEWTNADFDLRESYVPFPDRHLRELLCEAEIEVSDATRAWASGLMDRHVYGNHGFFILEGSSYIDLSPEQGIHLTQRLAPCLGKPIVHHSKHLKQDLVTNIKDQGVRFSSSKNQNFNASNQEAIEHTESTELPEPIGAFLLHSIQPAYKGGANRFVNAYTLLDRLMDIDPGYIEVLKRPFFFDTARGERVEAPIVTYDAHLNQAAICPDWFDDLQLAI